MGPLTPRVGGEEQLRRGFCRGRREVPPTPFPPLSEPALSHIYIWRLGRGEGWYAGGRGAGTKPHTGAGLPNV